MLRGYDVGLRRTVRHRAYALCFDESCSEVGRLLREVRRAGPLAVAPDCGHALYQLVWDDYGYRAYRHAARAIDDLFGSIRHKPVILPRGQALAIKHPA